MKDTLIDTHLNRVLSAHWTRRGETKTLKLLADYCGDFMQHLLTVVSFTHNRKHSEARNATRRMIKTLVIIELFIEKIKICMLVPRNLHFIYIEERENEILRWAETVQK